MDIVTGSFIWDAHKETENIRKHGINFSQASLVFIDPRRKIFHDSKHSGQEERFFCIGVVSRKVMTVRFTYRGDKIRLIGAGHWRGARRYYDQA